MSELTRAGFREALLDLLALIVEDPNPDWHDVERRADLACDRLWASMEDDFIVEVRQGVEA